jgi:diadenosine tetraphosphatase ApaH/serine/threonine PP2A family protein phosphatase
LTAPQEWGYIFDIDDAYPNFRILEDQICFIGHSHRPVVFTADDIVDCFLEERIIIQKEIKYIINIGSVGQPRDGNPKSSYAIYDTDEGLVEIRRLSYNIKRVQEKIIQAGLPRILAERLSIGR